MRFKIRCIRSVDCEYEVVKEEEVTRATAKLVWGCTVLASNARPNKFGGGTPFPDDGAVAANVSV